MLADLVDSFVQMFTPPFRGVMVKSVLLTALVLVLGGFAVDRAVLYLIPVGPGWLATLLSLAVALGLVIGLVFLAAPTTLLVASFYIDDIAAIVEREIDPLAPPGRAAPAIQAALTGMRFAALSIAVNLIALVGFFALGVGVAAFFLANGYLLGREYFELAAMRHRSPAEARAMRRDNSLTVYAYGAALAVFVAVPVLNLFTPLFATAMMTRLHWRLSRRFK